MRYPSTLCSASLWLGLLLSTSTTQPIESRFASQPGPDQDDHAGLVSIHTQGYSAYDCNGESRISDFTVWYPGYFGKLQTFGLPEASLPNRPMSFKVDPIANAPAGWDYRFYTRSDCSGFEDESCALKPNAKGCLSPPVGVWIDKVAIKAPATTITTTVIVTASRAANQKRTAEPAVLTATPSDAAPVTTTVTTTSTATA